MADPIDREQLHGATIDLMAKTLRAMNDGFTQIADASNKTLVAFEQFGRFMAEMFVTDYLDAGAPYGPTVAGLTQWWRERSSHWLPDEHDDPTQAAIARIRMFQRYAWCDHDGRLLPASELPQHASLSAPLDR